MTQTTNNTSPFIHAQQYSNFIHLNLPEMLLPPGFTVDVSDFTSGNTYNMKAIGARTLQDVTQNEDLTINPLDTNTLTLTITEHVGNAFAITQELREDGDQIDRLLQEAALEDTRLIAEDFEAKWLQAAYNAQTAANPNTIAGFAHRKRASGGNQQLTEADLIDMALAFDKAKVPMAGRIGIVDPVVAATFNRLVTTTAGLDRTPMFQSAFESGFTKNHKFIGNIFGWDLYTSNLLPDVAAGTDIDGTNTLTNAGKANIFMNVLDDATKPMMSAWRRMPRTETQHKAGRGGGVDEFFVTARYGHGVRREDTLGVIVTDGTAVA